MHPNRLLPPLILVWSFSCKAPRHFEHAQFALPRTGQPCVEDTDCPQGHVCIQEVCEDVWCEADTDCPGGMTCDLETNSCTGGAFDQCLAAGDLVCVEEDSYAQCGDFNVDTYLEWSDPIDCAVGQVCLEGICLDCGDQGLPCCPALSCNAGLVCAGGQCRIDTGCSDVCSEGSQTCADASSFQLCGNFSGDICFGWSEPFPCGTEYLCELGSGNCIPKEGCGLAGQACCQGSVCYYNAACVNGTCEQQTGCVDDCSLFQPEDRWECVDTHSFHKCGLFDQDPCLDWSEPIACPENQACIAGFCTLCPDCPRECIDGQSYRVCLQGEVASCQEWSQPQDCPPLTTCVGAGECQDCNPGATDGCDGIDNDCDNLIDEDCGALRECVDENSYRECVQPSGVECLEWGEPISCGEGNLCEGKGICVICGIPGTADGCDNIDNDCDGTTDEDCGALRECVDDISYHECVRPSGAECLEWGQRVSCGEGNSCQGQGECIPCGPPDTLDDCDGIDNDCDRLIDEDCANPTSSGCDCASTGAVQPVLPLLLVLLASLLRLRARAKPST